jgi:hypothetical protein
MTRVPKWKRWTREGFVAHLRESNQVRPDRRLVAMQIVIILYPLLIQKSGKANNCVIFNSIKYFFLVLLQNIVNDEYIHLSGMFKITEIFVLLLRKCLFRKFLSVIRFWLLALSVCPSAFKNDLLSVY